MAPTPKRSFRIADPLWEAAVILGRREGISMSDVVRKALELWVRDAMGMRPAPKPVVDVPPRSYVADPRREDELRIVERFHDTKSASDALGVAMSTLKVWRHEGWGPPYIIKDGQVLYSRISLDEWKMQDWRPKNTG